MSAVPGLRGTAVVAKDGLIEADFAEGLADVRAGVACSLGTPFQVCSVSKQFAAAGVMLLVEAGQLRLGESVDRWLPEGPRQWQQVTLHQLLSHTAGVPHWHEAPGLDPSEPMTITARLQAIWSAPLRTEPGALWHYSSPGFVLAGLIVERASGQPYAEFVTEQILSPLGLAQTTMGGTPDRAARGYRDGQPVTPWDLAAMPGTGDIWSTARDLTRFTAALHGGELIAPSSLRAICTPHAAIDDQDDEHPRLTTTGYGYGMFTGTFAGHAAFFHPGDNPGYQSLACWIPDLEASIVILVNDEDVNMTGILRQLLPLVLG
jgi:CubicO group peptidase (beta-lactamase class C family)